MKCGIMRHDRSMVCHRQAYQRTMVNRHQSAYNRQSRRRINLTAALLLGVFVSLGVSLVAHLFSPDHHEHVHHLEHRACADHHHEYGAHCDDACVLSLYAALSYDGVVIPVILAALWSWTESRYPIQSGRVCAAEFCSRSSRAPPSFAI